MFRVLLLPHSTQPLRPRPSMSTTCKSHSAPTKAPAHAALLSFVGSWASHPCCRGPHKAELLLREPKAFIAHRMALF